MDRDESLHWLLLARLPGCSDSILRNLQTDFEDPRELLQAPEHCWRRAGADAGLLALRHACGRARAHSLWDQAMRDLDCLQASDSGMIPLGSNHYPPLLREIHDPPPLLFFRGDAHCLSMPALAVVGSRRASAAGERAARELAADLGMAGFLVCSGLALGIDGAAHRGAMQAGAMTVAVMATGIDQVYPRAHAKLALEIADQGVLLSEFPPGSPPRRQAFPRRNRLVSGLSLGVLVVEAALRSGSLITARTAMEQNREVFALPHSIYDPGGRGCHSLIRNGATLVESAADMLVELGSLCAAHRELCAAASPVDGRLPAHLQDLLRALGHAPIAADQLASQMQIPAGSALAGLAELELLGVLESRDGLYMLK